jgi:cullin 3
MPNSGLDAMIDANKLDDLARLYNLFTMVPAGLPCLKKSLKESIARRGKEINRVDGAGGSGNGQDEVAPDSEVKGKARPNTGAQTLALALKWVQDVLDLKDCFDQVWKRSFQRDRELESALNDVCVYDDVERSPSQTRAFLRLLKPSSISTTSPRNTSPYSSTKT